jgi:hypothetical protein
MKSCNVILILLAAVLLGACGTPSRYAISNPSAKAADDRIVGKWKYEEDTNKNNFYAITKAYKGYPHQYHVKFWNRGGTNPTYEFNVYFSEIDGTKFINIPFYEKLKQPRDGKDWENKGYFFLKVVNSNQDFSRITTATVNDKALKKMKNSSEVRKYLAKNINNPKSYSDTAHFYKVRE